ncbi:MAG: glycosyltransferase family 2 protein [Candidatus Omnitrophota bacterium]
MNIPKPVLSIIIPARNESKNLAKTVEAILGILDSLGAPSEILIVNDHSKDSTAKIAEKIIHDDNRVKLIENDGNPGYGIAVRKGLEYFKGDYVMIVMADASDSPADIPRYYEAMCQGYECVFGTRFSRKSKLVNYPFFKLIINRLGNLFIQALFWIPCNDVTNAFKCYSRVAIEGMYPLISHHFNLTVEMPLKAIIRGYKWKVIPIDWHGRVKGFSKWNIKETGSRYLFIILYLWLEKSLSRGDYYRRV